MTSRQNNVGIHNPMATGTQNITRK